MYYIQSHTSKHANYMQLFVCIYMYAYFSSIFYHFKSFKLLKRKVIERLQSCQHFLLTMILVVHIKQTNIFW